MQAIKAVLPAFALYASDASTLHPPPDESCLLDEPSAAVKAVVNTLSQVCSLPQFRVAWQQITPLFCR